MSSSSNPGDTLGARFNYGLVAASYLASLCGCQLTVEILHRRSTALGSWRSWMETISCAVSMGLVGVWCMHFIGNRAIVVGGGEPRVQLVYESGFTVLSLILPVLGLTAAFSAAEYQFNRKWVHWTALMCTGVFAGLSVVGMHYVANLGVKHHALHYNTRYLVASFVISVGDCLAVLILFYTLREKWISAWWKRVGCAMALAVGVSAMHFTAATDCEYMLKSYSSPGELRSRDIQVAIAGSLCGACALLVTTALMIARSRDALVKTRSQKVMLACAIFDPSGRILVTTDGILPAREITDKYNHRTFDDEFDTAHPVFQWIYRVTHHWASVGALIPKMKSHLHAHREDLDSGTRPNSSASSAIFDAETYNNFALVFQERFCTAAASMASSMNMPIERLGVLYDRVIDTGTLNRQDPCCRRRWRRAKEPTPAEVEAALRHHLFGKGQLMFITRQASEEDCTQLLNAGYKFASVQHVGRTIANAMQITLSVLEGHISSLKRYNESLVTTEKPGTWLSFFAMVPKPHHKGFDVVVKKEQQDQLPDVQLLQTRPEAWQICIFERLNDKQIPEILDKLDDRTGQLTEGYMLHELQFMTVLRQAILTLIQPFPQEWVREAKFWSRQLIAHFSRPLEDRSDVTTIYSFTVIGDMHASIDGSPSLTRIPRSFFDARHRCYAGSPDHAVLTRDIHQAFAPIFVRRQARRTHRMAKLSVAMGHTPLKRVRQSHSRGSGKLSSSASSVVPVEYQLDDASSMHELVDKPYYSSTPSRSSDQPSPRGSRWGGILVNRETTMKADITNDPSANNMDLVMPFGNMVAVGTLKPDVTFVDELVTVTKQRFLPASNTI
ncbi:hypothetical protein DOTSEDRAFT_88624 [Lecanosticta acicola]|uniref:MHYT domain-containing protein n=1 Tax=Lecanosticta acicola TaxID=111012 RepID=A0AAI8Z868_9PEZI|nr:hypothetical protein DOTSEDRAFT_88624 [Lecanosticta acicola]